MCFFRFFNALSCTGKHATSVMFYKVKMTKKADFWPNATCHLAVQFGDGLKNLSFCVTLPWKRDEDLPFFTGGIFCKHLTHWAGGQLFASRGAFACALRAPAHGNVYKKTSLVPVKWPVKKWCFCRKRQMVKRVI